jgi:hypothetical protein
MHEGQVCSEISFCMAPLGFKVPLGFRLGFKVPLGFRLGSMVPLGFRLGSMVPLVCFSSSDVVAVLLPLPLLS